MKKLMLLSVLVLMACEKPKSDDDLVTNQCRRIELYERCLEKIPQGPDKVGSSNDWDEVVQQCDSNAYWQSKQQRKFIEPKCQGG